MDATDAASSFDIERLTRLAFEFGPFFFALLFLFVATRMAYRRYEEAKQAATDPADPDLCTHRRVYVGTTATAFLLVSVAVGIWLYGQFEDTVARFTVLDLTEEEFLVSDSTYSLVIPAPRPAATAPLRKNFHFAAIVSRFGDHGTSQLVYWNERLQQAASFAIPNDPRNTQRFRISQDPPGRGLKLVPLAAAGSGGLVRSAVAAEPIVGVPLDPDTLEAMRAGGNATATRSAAPAAAQRAVGATRSMEVRARTRRGRVAPSAAPAPAANEASALYRLQIQQQQVVDKLTKEQKLPPSSYRAEP